MAQVHKQGLWLWAGALSWLLIATLPLAVEVQAIATLVVTALLVLGWRRTQRAAKKHTPLQWGSGVRLPAGSYRHPVVLAVGDCLAELFGASSAEQLAPRVTVEGCYVPSARSLEVVRNRGRSAAGAARVGRAAQCHVAGQSQCP